jgi:hypothetical protein
LYDSLVQPIIDYGASVWGTKSYNCISAVQNRAMRCFLGVGKKTPIAAMEGDMGWRSPEYRQWVCVIRQWCRFLCMDDERINKIVFRWAVSISDKKKTSYFHVKKFLRSVDLHDLCKLDSRTKYQNVKKLVINNLSMYYERLWLDKLNRICAINGNGMNKLRTYRKFKKKFATESYVMIVNRKQRQAFAKFRCGVAPIRIETGRYVGESVDERVCKICNNGEVEDEEHCLIRCSAYDEVRVSLFSAANDINQEFHTYSDEEKFIFLMSNHILTDFVSKACLNILNLRSCEIYA